MIQLFPVYLSPPAPGCFLLSKHHLCDYWCLYKNKPYLSVNRVSFPQVIKNSIIPWYGCVGGLCYKSVSQPYIDLREKCASQIVYESHLGIISQVSPAFVILTHVNRSVSFRSILPDILIIKTPEVLCLLSPKLEGFQQMQIFHLSVRKSKQIRFSLDTFFRLIMNERHVFSPQILAPKICLFTKTWSV